MARYIQEARKNAVAEESTRIVLRPTAVNDSGFKVFPNEDGSFTVTGEKPERWVKQTDFNNSEAVGYLADRLANLGIEKALFKAGAVAKDEVRIGLGDEAVIFDWEPTIEAGAELLASPRGTDLRIDPWTSRHGNSERDQLNEDEIKSQWEFNVADPHTPVVREAKSEMINEQDDEEDL
jgi:GTP-binding protein